MKRVSPFGPATNRERRQRVLNVRVHHDGVLVDHRAHCVEVHLGALLRYRHRQYGMRKIIVEQAARHPSCIAVGVSTGCWAHRRATIRVHADMSYEFLSHKGVTL